MFIALAALRRAKSGEGGNSPLSKIDPGALSLAVIFLAVAGVVLVTAAAVRIAANASFTVAITGILSSVLVFGVAATIVSGMFRR